MADVRWAVAVLVGGGAAHAEELQLGKKATHVTVASVAGTLRVRAAPADADGPVVVTSDRIDTRLCDLTVERKKDKATVTFGPKSAAQPEPCSTDIVVLLPPGVVADVTLGAGPVRVDAVPNDLTVTATAGDLTLGATSGAVKAMVVSGNARLEGSTGPVDLEVAAGEIRGSATGPLVLQLGDGLIDLGGLADVVTAKSAVGHVTLRWATVPEAGTIRGEASNGNVVVDLPGNPAIHCIAASTLGDSACDLPQDDSAPLTVHVLTGTGSVRVF